MTKIVIQYGLTYIALTILLMVIGIVAEVYFDFDIGSGASTALPFVAAITIGSWYFGREGKVPDPGFSWRVSFYTLPVSLLLTAIFVSLILWSEPPELAFASGDPTAITLLLTFTFVVVSLLHLLMVRFGFRFGAKTQKTALDKKKAREDAKSEATSQASKPD